MGLKVRFSPEFVQFDIKISLGKIGRGGGNRTLDTAPPAQCVTTILLPVSVICIIIDLRTYGNSKQLEGYSLEIIPNESTCLGLYFTSCSFYFRTAALEFRKKVCDFTWGNQPSSVLSSHLPRKNVLISLLVYNLTLNCYPQAGSVVMGKAAQGEREIARLAGTSPSDISGTDTWGQHQHAPTQSKIC